MANLSKIRRDKMLEYLEKLKVLNNDDKNIRAITEIENALNEKKYGLVWEEHSEQVNEMLEDNIPVFVEDEKRKIIANKDEAYNFLLEGDNLHSLKLLEKTHKGKVDVIYIDPPYNTCSAFYHYDDNLEHNTWLSLINPRLELLTRLLSDEGSIWISIDDDEGHYLKVLCNEIFGRNYFVTKCV